MMVLNILHETKSDRDKELIAKYGKKDKLPTQNDLEAYIVCKYDDADLIKFCNEKDTKTLLKAIEKEAAERRQDVKYDVFYDKPINALKSNPKSAVRLGQNREDHMTWYYVSSPIKKTIGVAINGDIHQSTVGVKKSYKNWIF